MSEEVQAQKQPQKIAKTVKKTRIDEQSSDFAYWQAQPYAARLIVLEDIRRAYIAWKYDTDPRFQRVYTIVKQP